MDNTSNQNNKDPLKEFLEEQLDETRPRSLVVPTDSKIHFLFLYASPLITYFKDAEGKVGKRQIFNEIDYLTELKQVQDVLQSSQREIKFLSVPASLERLSLSLDKNPLALHFCGHGVRNNEETFGIGYNVDEGDFLILEDEMGGAYFLSCKNLENLLKRLKTPLNFVFVASCHSKIVGEVFLKAGALHVICVKREERILDIACQVFSKAFYHACLTGEHTICEAFGIARDQVRLHEGMPPGEEKKFVLLIKDEDDIYCEHSCSGWIDAGPGSFLDMCERSEYHQLPSRIESFLGRNEVMHDLIGLVLTSRLVTLRGIAGIGKSSLVKETVRYLYERKHFRNGIIYLNLNCCDTKEGVASCLISRILGGNARVIESRKEYRGRMVHQIVEELGGKEVLLVFDNIPEMMLVNEKENFHAFLDLLLSNCNDLKILSTSRTSLGDGPLADYAEKIITLGPLSDEDSKNLLLARAPRTITNEEIEELLNMEIEGIYGLPLENKKEFVGHAFFELFGGHPQAITLAASLLEEKKLKEVFLHLKENSVINAFDYGVEMSERDKKGFNSLKGSLDVSFNSLMKKNQSAGKLLTFLGLFPAGIQEEDLSHLWDKSFKNDSEVLLKSSLLRKTQKDSSIHYSLFPFMAKYAEERLTYTEKREYHDKILLHFAKKAEDFYKVIGTISKEAEKTVSLLIRYELNIRACIFRELAFQGNEDLEKSLYDSFNLNTSNIRINERFKDIEAIKEDEEDDFPLTKTNIEMHQKRFEANKTSLKHNASLSGNSLRSSSPIYITENMANQLKTPRSRVEDNFNLTKSDNFQFKFTFGNLSHSGAASASLENSNNILENSDNTTNNRYSITPDPFLEKNNPFKQLEPLARADYSLNNEQITILENRASSHKDTPKWKEGQAEDREKLRDILESPQIQEDSGKEEKPVYVKPTIPKLEFLGLSKTNSKTVRINSDDGIEKSTLKVPHPLRNTNQVAARISQNSNNSLNNSQEIFPNLRSSNREPSNKEPHYRLRGGNVRKSISIAQGQVLPANKLIIYYSSILFLLRRYGESIKMLKYGIRIARNNNDLLAEANYYRIFGVVSHLRKQAGKAVDDFTRAKELFYRVGCSIGVAICEAGLGYIKISENCDVNLAREHLEKSLKIYENLEHTFGIHFLNRWLGIAKQKTPNLKREAAAHFQAANKIKQIKKEECIISEHKGGFFVLRWMGDPISLLLEASLTTDPNDRFKKKKAATPNIIISTSPKVDEGAYNNEIRAFSTKMKIKLDSSIEIENNSVGMDDSLTKTPVQLNRQFNNFMDENEETASKAQSNNNAKGNPHTKKPPQMPKMANQTGRKSFPSNQQEKK